VDSGKIQVRFYTPDEKENTWLLLKELPKIVTMGSQGFHYGFTDSAI
jgi:hypothetical protein